MEIRTIVDHLNNHAQEYDIGQLQEIRKEILKLKRKPCRDPFGHKGIFEDYAFHAGGSNELQFNVGFELNRFRWGVAISLQASRTVPDIDVMIPKVERLNEFLRLYADSYLRDFLMWHFKNHKKSEDHQPQAIPPSLFVEGVFIFLGKHSPKEAFNTQIVLKDFDRLLPLYEFVESDRNDFPVVDNKVPFEFKPGHSPRESFHTTATNTSQRIDIALRHSRLQDRLVQELLCEEGVSVASEHKNGIGGLVDVIAKRGEDFEFFEIKIGGSPRSCIRQALGQLLEYGLWPGAIRPSKLVVVGEPILDAKASEYLRSLREEFGLPIHYRRISLGHDSG